MVVPVRSLWPLVGVLVVLLGLTNSVQSQHAFVVAPNTFRLGAAETITVYSHSGPQDVTVSLADYPGKKNTFFTQKIRVVNDAPQTLTVTVKPEHIPDLNITGPLDHHYVYLMVHSGGKWKEYKVLVTLHSGYLFIQTDKPIYTPKQEVKIRLIRLNEDLLVDTEPFTLQIRNPQGTIVDSKPSKDLESSHGMYNYAFKIPGYSLLGEWSVTVLYGLKVKLNSTVKFELAEYVLPTFQVEVKGPDVIFDDTEQFEVSAKAKYVYGKNVEGDAVFKLKVKLESGHTVDIGTIGPKKLFEGLATCEISTSEIKKEKKIGWFPGISGARFLVEAIVYEFSSGAKENGTWDETIFSPTPYIIGFQKSLSDFRPGIDAVVQAQITHVHGKPATDVAAKITVLDHNNNAVPVKEPHGRSNEEGLVAFLIETQNAHKFLKVTVETVDDKHPSKGTITLHAFKSPINDAYIGISKANRLKYEIGGTFSRSIYTNPPSMNQPISYLVVSKGKILASGSNWPSKSVQRSLSFKVTADMVPSARVLIFTVYGNHLLTDSFKFTVEKVCQPNSLITLEAESDRKPGEVVHLKVKGKPNTMVGILAVDTAVYALRNKDKLTGDKMFNEMDKHDLGCGPGGGLDSTAVLTNAGVIIIADTVALTTERKSCLERKLRKREISEEITREHGQGNEKCCRLGKLPDKHKRTCEVRAEIIRRFEESDFEDKEGCASVFLKCCEAIQPKPAPGLYSRPLFPESTTTFGRSNNEAEADEVDFPDEEELGVLESGTAQRKDFRETWLWDSGVIGPSGVMEQNRTLLDSITTWVVQAVGLSGAGGGMCVANPKKIVAFQDVFIDAKMPYNVVKNEQIEIPVTIFNYGHKRLMMLVYTYGVEGLCSDAEPGQKGTRKKIYVNSNSAETVAFQMIPLVAKDFSITFSAMSSGGSDTVVKTLSVIPEGVQKEEFITFAVDPANTEKRKRRNVVNEKYEARFDNENKKQLSIVKLTPEVEFVVPGTEYAVVEAYGDRFGPSIETSLNDPDRFLKLPLGCGEQTMMSMGPTVYTFHYLKATGKVNSTQEANAYKFIRGGYQRELTYRKPDGSYAAWLHRPSSTWLTAFVARVFCQAGKYVFIDENVVCSALNWLVTKQKPDGTFVETSSVIHQNMRGGVNGDITLTAFSLISFQKCNCKNAKLQGPKERAANYLRSKVPVINDHYRMALTAYALALFDSESAIEANEKLLQMVSFDPASNTRYWGDGKSAISVEATSYALLTQLLYKDLEKSTSIVNWLNSKRGSGGGFVSTQDTVVAIEALAEYAIFSREPDISLVMNITTNSDPNFKHTWRFEPDNARVKRQVELSKVKGNLIIDAEGTGSGVFGVRLRYNIANSPDAICKFDVNVTVSEAVNQIKKDKKPKAVLDFDFNGVPPKLVKDLGIVEKNVSQALGRSAADRPQVFGSRQNNRFAKPLSNDDLGFDYDLRDDQLDEPPKVVWKRDLNVVINPPVERALGVPKSSLLLLNLTICARYLGDGVTNMAIVDVGMLTGFKPVQDDLKNLVRDNSQTIDRFEINGRNLIFYLEKFNSNATMCFSFRIQREFVASNLESGLVRVYDYYEPNQACSQFYRSQTTGPVLGKVCFDEKSPDGKDVVNKVCKCAEGGCPPEKPFKEVFEAKSIHASRILLADWACNERDYFWKVKVLSIDEKMSGYTHYKMHVVKVLKEGREKKDEVEDDEREFLARGNCPASVLSVNTIYYIMGRDSEPIEVDGEPKYKYFIDKTTLIRAWIDVNVRGSRKITRIEKKRQNDVFSNIERKFEKQEACTD